MMDEKRKPETATSMRLPQEWIDRADEVAEKLENGGELAAFGTVTRATVLRLAVARGLADLELDVHRQAPGYAYYQGPTFTNTVQWQLDRQREREHMQRVRSGAYDNDQISKCTE